MDGDPILKLYLKEYVATNFKSIIIIGFNDIISS